MHNRRYYPYWIVKVSIGIYWTKKHIEGGIIPHTCKEYLAAIDSGKMKEVNQM